MIFIREMACLLLCEVVYAGQMVGDVDSGFEISDGWTEAWSDEDAGGATVRCEFGPVGRGVA